MSSNLGIRVHGGFNLRGSDTEIHGLELEELATDPTSANIGGTWINTSLNQVSYVDTNNSIRRIASDVDINNLLSISQAIVVNNTTSEFIFGQPLYGVIGAQADLAVATDATKKDVLGLVFDPIINNNGNSGKIAVLGKITGTTEQWDLVTGQTGGLTPNAKYFLDVIAGNITASPPFDTAKYLCPVGQALSATIMSVKIGQTILL